MTYSNVAGGDIIYASTVNDLIRYGPAKPICEVRHTSGATVTNATDTRIDMNGEVFDDLGWHSTVSNTSRVTPTIAGRYKVTLLPVYAFNTAMTGTQPKVYKNGSLYRAGGSVKPSSGSNTATYGGEMTCYVDMNGTTDYVEGYTYQTSTGSVSQTLNGSSASGYTTMIVELERAA